ncbi:ZINC TRANSPORTER [Salix purpurea]|uniref:ZINC TRANSPORTER n=1 Tax=Salix purpurea TaxID=77065 RepID=A0A9Q0ZHV4_SALPP|nr:ZINC TRANSPORTER [Salix purpurea]
MMTPRQISEDRGVGSSPHFRHTPLQIIHVIGNFLRIWSVYSMYSYFSQTGASVVLFIFTCLIPSSILFLALQKPWKGRALSNQQVVPSVINGVITALYFILWGKGLKSCGPVRAILAEYSGAVLGVLSAALYGRRGHIWKKIGGLIAMLASFYFLSQGMGHGHIFPLLYPCADPIFLIEFTEEVLGMGEMVVPILAGILSALRRVIARRVSLKNQLKRRLNAITITSATCFLFPVAMWDFITGSTSGNSVQLPFSTWAFLSTTLFGVILIFYIDSIAEERLHMVFSSPRHLMVAGGCIIVMEIVYKMDFSLPGFIICSLLLGFGIYEATALERGKKGSFQEPDPLTGVLEDQVQMSPLPT